METVCRVIWKPHYKKLEICTNHITRTALYEDPRQDKLEIIFIELKSSKNETETKLKDRFPTKTRNSFSLADMSCRKMFRKTWSPTERMFCERTLRCVKPMS